MIIFLLGYMGSGKTKTGELLARKLGYDFFDTDQLIELETGKSVSEIFSSQGEDSFRNLETKVLHSLEGKEKVVVATGGGLPCFHDNMKWMNEQGLTIYLTVPDGMLVQRLLTSGSDRPLIRGLTETELRQKVSEQVNERKPFYTRSKLIFHAANMDIKSLLEKVKEAESEIR